MVESKDNCCKMMDDAMLEGYALLKIMKNADNEPYDYSIIEINNSTFPAPKHALNLEKSI